jgi:hypothetical protein
MSWTRQTLRAMSVLGLTLVFYAATPHLHRDVHRDVHRDFPRDVRQDFHRELSHAPHQATRAPEPIAGAIARLALADATQTLARDDAHESHSSSASSELHPCTLCREKGRSEMGSTPAATLHRVEPLIAIATPIATPMRVELLIARRHPVRAPPLA